MPGVLTADRLSYTVSGHRILQEVSLTAQGGEILALAGPNGAGKSTLIGLLAGDLKPTAGQVTFDGCPVGDIGVKTMARRRSVVLQESQVSFAFTVAQVVRMGRAPWRGLGSDDDDDAAVAAALAATDTLELAGRVFRSLSGGEKARVTFARALAQQAEVLLLDEPTAALDIRHQELVMSLARREASRGRTVLAVLHDLSLATAWADRLALLEGGRLVAAGPVAQVATAEQLSALYRHPIRVWPDAATGLAHVAPLRGETSCLV